MAAAAVCGICGFPASSSRDYPATADTDATDAALCTRLRPWIHKACQASIREGGRERERASSLEARRGEI